MQHSFILGQKENNWSDIDKKMLKGFIEYVFSVLIIKDPVKIYLKKVFEGDNLDISVNLRLAYVIPEERKIIVYCHDRGLLDILRSIAHELIHMQQKDTGKLTNQNIEFYLKDENSEGYDLEYEAYGLSGIIVRNYRALLNNE